MTSAETLLQEHGAVKVQLTIRSSKAAVLSFYDRLGYQDAQVQVRSKWLKP
jgi:ribosomal protein S18 acetylase RimI-like enzyme